MRGTRKHFINTESIANLGIVLGQRTNTFYKPPGAGDAGVYVEGFYYSLLESRTPFEFVHEEDDFSPDALPKYSALILPKVALLSVAQCAQLEAFVQAGLAWGRFDHRGPQVG